MSQLSVLLVDDEDEYRKTAIKRLQKRGIDVTGAAEGAEALKLLESKKYTEVVLDVRMPGMDGIEVLRAIKTSQPLVEVIMLTGHANMEVAIEGMELGAFDYLMKPIDIDELVYKIQDAFKKRSLQLQKIADMQRIRG